MPQGPSDKTLKILFAQSQNRCAAPDCDNPVIARATSLDGPAPVAQVAHIVARSSKGPRGDPNFPTDQLHEESNLILLCGHHHVLVDAQDSTFTVDELHRWKRAVVESTPDLRATLDLATEMVRSRRWEDAIALFNRVAATATDADGEVGRLAHTGAARCLLVGQFAARTPDEGVLAQIEQHLDCARAAGARHAQVMATRAWIARLRRDPELALTHAADALESADGLPRDRADAVHVQLDALLALGRPDEALKLCNGLALDALEAADGLSWLELGVSRLIVLAEHRAPRLPADVEAFIGKAQALVSSPRPEPDRIGPLEVASRLSELGSVLAGEGLPVEALKSLVAAEGIACRQSDHEVTLSVALQAIQLAAHMNDESTVRQMLGSAASLAGPFNKDEDPSAMPTFRLSLSMARGRSLVELASGDQREPESATVLLAEALGALADAATIIDTQRDALAHRNNPEMLRAEVAYWRGHAASGIGRSAEAALHFRDVRSDAARADPHFWRQRGILAWVSEAKSLRTSGRLAEAHRTLLDAIVAVGALCGQSPDDAGAARLKDHAAAFRRYIEETELPVFEWLESPAAREIGLTSQTATLHESVADQVLPFVSWCHQWNTEFGGTGDARPFAEFLDFWGRGGLCRVASAVRTEAHRAVAVDARSIDEIRRWARILCPVFDTVVVKWKGWLGDGVVQCPIEASYGGPGGHGYDVANEAIYETSSEPPVLRWVMSVSSAALVAQELAAFLAGEAMPLVQAGRLILVPASLVGCTQSAVGWTDDLFVNSLLGGAVSVVGAASAASHDSSSPQRILDLGSTMLPYIENVSLADLSRVLDDANDWLTPLRAVILRAVGSNDLRYERWEQLTVMQDDIISACRELEDRYGRLARTTRHDTWQVTHVSGGIVAAERPERSDPATHGDPITELLRSIGGVRREPSPWVPYWLLRGTGGHLSWSGPLDNRSFERAGRTAEQKRPRLAVSSWLHPGTAGFGIRPAIPI